jgi:hypothetical protein
MPGLCPMSNEAGSNPSEAAARLIAELQADFATENLPGQQHLQRFSSLLRSGISVSDALLEVAPIPQAEKTLMRRASFVRVFDRAMFDAVLQVDKLPFETCVAMHGVDQITKTKYRVKDFVAVGHLREWLGEDRDAIRAFARQVYKFISNNPGSEKIDILRYHIAAYPAAAVAEFDQMFQAADEAFDLALCHALIQALRDLDNLKAGEDTAELKLLSPEFVIRRDDLTPYVSARGRFIEDYAKSAVYLERVALKERALQFAVPSGDWILPIYGAGGRGKSIFLQWFVGRYCVPQPRRISVAKVDFDDINVAKLAKCPSLVLLRFAEELDRQIEYSPFSDLFVSYGKYTAILVPAARLPKDLNVDQLEREFTNSASFASELEERFIMKLGSLRAVTILDTVEEGVIHFPDALRSVIALLRRVHAACSGLKLVLSGRHNLVEKGFLDPSDPGPIEVPPFSDDEAKRYLVERRSIEDGEALVSAIVRKASGNPFSLALIADMVKAKQVTDVAAVNALRPEFEYLIRRIIDHIPNTQYGVRWVIRYGVIPRRLTRDFLTSVMEPRLREEASQPTNDQLQEYAERFRRDAGSLDSNTLWSELANYAASNGWLRATAEDLRFQPEVVKPMRALLMMEKIHAILHRDAYEWFEKKAEGDPGRWAEWMAEALYHRFELRDPGAETGWRSSLVDARAQASRPRRTLLEVVTGFVERDESETGQLPRVEIVSSALAGWAFLEHALSSAGIRFGPCELEEEAHAIRSSLSMARKLYPSEEWPAPVENLIEMGLALHDRTYPEVVKLGQVYTKPEDVYAGPQMYCYSLLLARAFAGLRDEVAEAVYDSAYQILRRSDSDYPASKILLESAEACARTGAEDRAIAIYQRVLEEALNSDPFESNDLKVDARIRIAELQLQTGFYAEALRVAGELEFSILSPSQRAGLERTKALSYAAQGRLHFFPEAMKIMEHRSDADLSVVEQARDLETRGTLHATRYNLASALPLLEQAYNMYRTADPDRADGALVTLVRVLKDLKGDWRKAQRLSTGPEIQSEALQIEYALLEKIQGREPDVSAIPEIMLLASVARREDPHPALQQLLNAIGLSRSRYARLRIFRWLPAMDAVSDLEKPFLEKIPAPLPDSDDYLAYVFDYIELLRVFRSSSALSILQSAGAESDNIFVLHGSIEAAAKLNAELPDKDVVLAAYRRWKQAGIATAMAVRYANASLLRGDKTNAELVINTIGETVPNELQGSAIEALHLENRASVASVQEEKVRLATAAARVLEILGQESTAMRMRARVLAGDIKIVTSSATADDRAVIPLKAIADPLDRTSNDGQISLTHVKALLASETEVVQNLQSALSEEWLSKKVVELDIDDAKRSALPWELAWPPNVVCYRSSKFLERTRPNVLLQLFWRQLPAKFRSLLSLLRPVRAVILRRPVSYQERSRRGFDMVSRRTLAQIYKSSGVTVFEPERLDTATVTDALRTSHPTVIHIQASVIEQEGTLILDLPILKEGSSATGELVTPDYLKVILGAVDTPNAPLLILDPPRPPDEGEVARQLLLRNRFATDLVLMGQTRAILCGGLFDSSSAELAALRLAQEIGLNPELRQLLLLHRTELGRDRFSKAAAIFATNPGDLVR